MEVISTGHIFFPTEKAGQHITDDVVRPSNIWFFKMLWSQLLTVTKHRLNRNSGELNPIYEDENYLILICRSNQGKTSQLLLLQPPTQNYRRPKPPKTPPPPPNTGKPPPARVKVYSSLPPWLLVDEPIKNNAVHSETCGPKELGF